MRVSEFMRVSFKSGTARRAGHIPGRLPRPTIGRDTYLSGSAEGEGGDHWRDIWSLLKPGRGTAARGLGRRRPRRWRASVPPRVSRPVAGAPAAITAAGPPVGRSW